MSALVRIRKGQSTNSPALWIPTTHPGYDPFNISSAILLPMRRSSDFLHHIGNILSVKDYGMSQLPASAVRTLRPQAVKNSLQRASAALGSAAPGPILFPPPAPPPAPPNNTVDLDVIGPRKLIRPKLPENARRDRRFQRNDEPVLMVRPAATHISSTHESSNAEAFYLQKQVQTQTAMVFVLDDGEKVEGCIEWYDRGAIKVRCTASPSFRTSRSSESGTRMLIYKSSIKYLYKAGENQPQF